MPPITLYDALEVSPRASAPVIKAAYRCLAQQIHPDKHMGNGEANAKLVALNHAYSVLSDPHRRCSYNRAIAALAGVMDRRGSGDTESFPRDPQAQEHPVSRAFAFRPLA